MIHLEIFGGGMYCGSRVIDGWGAKFLGFFGNIDVSRFVDDGAALIQGEVMSTMGDCP